VSGYIKNLVDRMVNDIDDYYVIEHKSKSGWFLFDTNQINNVVEFIWITDPQLCMGWASEDDASKSLIDIGISEYEVNVVALKNKSGE